MKEYFFLIKEFLSWTETIVHPIKKPDLTVKIESLCYPALMQLLIQTHTSEWAVLASGLCLFLVTSHFQLDISLLNH